MLSVPQIDTGKIDIFKQNYEQISIKFCFKNHCPNNRYWVATTPLRIHGKKHFYVFFVQQFVINNRA